MRLCVCEREWHMQVLQFDAWHGKVSCEGARIYFSRNAQQAWKSARNSVCMSKLHGCRGRSRNWDARYLTMTWPDHQHPDQDLRHRCKASAAVWSQDLQKKKQSPIPASSGFSGFTGLIPLATKNFMYDKNPDIHQYLRQKDSADSLSWDPLATKNLSSEQNRSYWKMKSLEMLGVDRPYSENLLPARGPGKGKEGQPKTSNTATWKHRVGWTWWNLLSPCM